MIQPKVIALKTPPVTVTRLIKMRHPVPADLIYEWLDGKPIYYQGFKKVIAGKLKREDIMGSSRIQAFFISLIVERLLPALLKTHKIFYSEMGVHIAVGDNLSTDIAIYRRSDLSAEWVMQDTYADTPPLIVIEVDTKAAPEAIADFNTYFTVKMEKYLAFGVQQVVWVFTKTKKIWIANNDGTPWLIADWDFELTVLEQSFNINTLIKENGFDPTSLKINQ
jgi:Uma2 family endonuclease